MTLRQLRQKNSLSPHTDAGVGTSRRRLGVLSYEFPRIFVKSFLPSVFYHPINFFILL